MKTFETVKIPFVVDNADLTNKLAVKTIELTYKFNLEGSYLYPETRVEGYVCSGKGTM